MQISLTKYRADFTDALLDFVVDQWRHLGDAVTPSERPLLVVDPEVLVALTTRVGRHDSRVFDGMIDWLARNGQWINVQRLARIAAEDGIADRPALGAVTAWLAARDRSMKWKKLAASLKPPAHAPSVPLFFRAAKTVRTRRQQDGVFAAYGLARAPVVIRGQAQPIHFRSPAAILCTSRALFGVAIRADVMAYLAVNERGHARGLAATLGYNHMQVRAVLLSLEQAGIATAVSYGRTHHYSIDMEAWRALLMEPGMTAQWINWRCLGRGFNSMVAGLWAIDASRADATVAESLVRDVMEAAREDILGTHAEMAHQRGLSRILGTSLADKIGTGANRRLHSPGRTL